LFSDGRLGLGLVLRGEDSRIVGATTKAQTGSGNVELSETLGLIEALKMIDALKLRSMIIEMDAATIVRAIQNKSYPRNQWGQLVYR
jgi:ribonuclease HI